MAYQKNHPFSKFKFKLINKTCSRNLFIGDIQMNWQLNQDI